MPVNQQPSSIRQLAAFTFTDIVGYTALMGNDEQKAFSILNKHRAIQKIIIERFKESDFVDNMNLMTQLCLMTAPGK